SAGLGEGGCVREGEIPLAAVGVRPEEGGGVGIDYQIDDNDAAGPRDRYVTWFGSNLNNNPAAYGTVILGAIDGGGPAIPVAGVAVTPTELTLEVGETAQLTASIDPSDADNTIVSWSTSDAGIADV